VRRPRAVSAPVSAPSPRAAQNPGETGALRGRRSPRPSSPGALIRELGQGTVIGGREHLYGRVREALPGARGPITEGGGLLPRWASPRWAPHDLPILPLGACAHSIYTRIRRLGDGSGACGTCPESNSARPGSRWGFVGRRTSNTTPLSFPLRLCHAHFDKFPSLGAGDPTHAQRRASGRLFAAEARMLLRVPFWPRSRSSPLPALWEDEQRRMVVMGVAGEPTRAEGRGGGRKMKVPDLFPAQNDERGPVAPPGSSEDRRAPDPGALHQCHRRAILWVR